MKHCEDFKMYPPATEEAIKFSENGIGTRRVGKYCKNVAS